MANILIGATGSVAATRVPTLVDSLTSRGHTVRVVATAAATHFFDIAERDAKSISLDEDEWPASGYTRGDTVLHIELRNWADAFLIAPLDANTLAKLVAGLCDNALTCVWRAWDWNKPVVLAPAMNTMMWLNPLTRKHLRSLAADFGVDEISVDLDEEGLMQQINDHAENLKIVPPISKRLACGDLGVGAMAEVDTIVETAVAMLH